MTIHIQGILKCMLPCFAYYTGGMQESYEKGTWRSFNKMVYSYATTYLNAPQKLARRQRKVYVIFYNKKLYNESLVISLNYILGKYYLVLIPQISLNSNKSSTLYDLLGLLQVT